MDHQEQHHEQHRKEREREKHQEHLRERAEENSALPFHPAWFVGLGLLLTGGALLIWILLF